MANYSNADKPIPSLQINAQTIKSLVRAAKLMCRKRQIMKKAIKPSVPAEILLLKKCNTKKAFKEVLGKLSTHWKHMIQYYLKDCFIYDIYNRKLECKLQLLAKRETLFAVVADPNLLDSGCHFDNNLVKNFCTGLANFIKRFYSEIVKATSSKFRLQEKETVPADCETTDVEHRSMEVSDVHLI